MWQVGAGGQLGAPGVGAQQSVAAVAKVQVSCGSFEQIPGGLAAEVSGPTISTYAGPPFVLTHVEPDGQVGQTQSLSVWHVTEVPLHTPGKGSQT